GDGSKEKKKIFRARKTMKISDRQQLESLHSTLLTAAPGMTDLSPPPLMNGTHKEDGLKAGDKEQNNISDSNSPQATSPASPALFLSLNLSPSPASSLSPKSKEETPASPTSPFHSLNFELKKMDEDEQDEQDEVICALLQEDQTTTEDPAVDLLKDSVNGLAPCSPVPPPVSDCTEPMDTDSDTTKTEDLGASTAKIKDEKTSCPKSTSSDSALPCPSSSHPTSSSKDLKQEKEIKEDINDEEDKKEGVKKGSTNEEKIEGVVKVETKKEKTEVGQTKKPPRPSSTPPSNTGMRELALCLFATILQHRIFSQSLSELNAALMPMDISLLNLAFLPPFSDILSQMVQQLLEERLKVLELTIFDKHFQELKDRVDKIDCATKHQTAITTLQVSRRHFSCFPSANPHTLALPAPATGLAHTPTSTAMVSQAPILQLITTTTSNAGSTLATGITTQSHTGTLLLKTASGSSLMAAGQPLLIQLPLSMANGQAGTLVNIPVSSLSAASSLGKSKTTTSTATFILKPAPAITTSPASAPAVATVPALQASTGQMSSAQLSLARAVYQGGAGGITTPNAGVSVTTARTPAQSVSVAGAMSSASSPATSGPAATGSTAPGPPQGTSLTSKTGGVLLCLTMLLSLEVSKMLLLLQSAACKNQVVGHSTSQINDSPMKSRTVTTSTPTRVLPPLPAAPAPPRLPPEAERTSPPQQPQLKLVPSQTGIVLSWCVAETDRTCAAVDSYHLYAFHQDNSNSSAAQQHWKKIGEVKALPLPMACTLTQFQSGSTYHFAVRAKDIYGRFGSFCEPQCTNVINSSSS
uniref:Activating transcription factor 7 interacting protein n=1 Tax=Sander lucioperca TaxID=283035 RepID=A0A8C9Z1M5_SANLU